MHTNAMTQTANHADVLVADQQTVDRDSLLQPLFKIFYTAIQNIKHLNYYTAKELVLPLLGTNQEVVFHWGFKGSGNLFTPLPSVQPQIRSALSQPLAQDTPSALKGIGYALLQNELYKHTKNASIIKWLTQAQLNPVKLFAIKLIMLIKTSMDSQQPQSNIYTELTRLLFRLNLSDEFHVLDKQQALSSLIPDDLRHAAEVQIPGIIEFIDELWIQLTSSAPCAHGSNYYSISCFVFRDQKFANTMNQRLSHYTGSHFITDASQLINLNDHQVVNLHDFIKFKTPQTPAQTASLSQKLVGFLYTTHTEHTNLPAAVKQAIEQTTSFPMIQLINAGNGEYWLYYVSNKLGTIDTIKAILLSFARTLHDYVALKKEILTSKDPAAAAYRQQCEEKERIAEIIQNFLETDAGKSSLARLTQEASAISSTAATQEQHSQKIQQQKEALEAEINNLKKQQEALKIEIERWEILKGVRGINQTKVQTTIKNLTEQINAFTQEIKQKQNAITRLEADLTQAHQSPEAQLAQDKKNLDALLALVAQQQNQGQIPSEHLLAIIAKLQNKIKQATTIKQPQQVDLDVRFDNREKCAKAFIDEANIMATQLRDKQAVIQRISDDEQRTIQELLFSQVEEGYTTYINQLRQEAQHILEQNKKATKLKNYKKAFTTGIVAPSAKNQQEMQQLEEQVGYLLAAGYEEDFLAGIRGTRTDFKELLSDLNHDEAFKDIKANLIATLTNILKNSEHVQNNVVLYQYLIRTYVPEFFPMLSQVAYNLAA